MSKHHAYRPRPLVLAVHAVLLSMGAALLVPASAVAADSSATAQATRSYDIAAGSLAEVLSRFASSAGVALSFDAALLNGRQSPGLHGEYSVSAGFATLLAGSGLQANRQGNGTFTLAPLPTSGALELDATTISSQLGNATTEDSHSYTSNVVTLGKGEHALKDIPQSVSVITRQRMDDQNLNTLDEVLEQSTGITTFQSPSGGKYIYSRGFEVDTYQYDGVAMNRRFYTRGNSFVADTLIYDRVELLRGANGLLQGTGAPGAAINLVRKRPKAEPAVSITASAGSWDTYRQSIDASTPLTPDGALRGRVVAGHEDRQYFYDEAESRKNVLYGILEYEFNPDTVAAVGASVEDLKSTPFFGGLPRNRDGSGVNVSRSTFFGADWNKWDNKQETYFADLTHDFSPDWRLKVAGSYVRETNDMLYAFSRGAINQATGNGLNARAYLYDFENTNKAIDANLTGKWRAFEREHEVIVGVNANDLENDDLMAGNYTIPGYVPNIYDPVSPPEPTYSQLLNTSYSAYTDGRIRQNGVYGVLRYKLAEPLTAVIGGRVSNYQSTFNSTSVLTGETTPSKVKETGVVTPYAGLIYALNEQWSAYVSYADIFQPQTDLTRDKATLKPIVGSNYELGLKGELLGGRVNTSFAVFRIDQENRAQYDDNDYAVAGGEVRAEGFEAEISGEALTDLQLFAGYTYTRTKNIKGDEEQGSTFNSYTPRHMLRLWADYRLPGALKNLSVGAGGSIQSENYNSNFGAGDIVQPGYAVWNARVGYRFNDTFSAAINGNNLFDKRYYSTVGHSNSESHFGDPRNYTLTLKADF